MNPIVLILAALVFPLVWGYLAEQFLRRIWPRGADSPNPDDKQPLVKRESPTPLPDYQI